MRNLPLCEQSVAEALQVVSAKRDAHTSGQAVAGGTGYTAAGFEPILIIWTQTLFFFSPKSK